MAPIIHWRACHVWDLLQGFGPEHGLPTQDIATAYGQGTELEEVAARTGCVECNLASKDLALDRVLRHPEWGYLAPLKRLKPLYAELKKPHRRLRKTEAEHSADGSLVSNLHRLGPMLMETRLWGLEQVLEIQRDINTQAILHHRPTVELIDGYEEARIRELISANTWPDKWTGEEETGAAMFDRVMQDGSIQPILSDIFHDRP